MCVYVYVCVIPMYIFMQRTNQGPSIPHFIHCITYIRMSVLSYKRSDDVVVTGSFSSICRGFCFIPYDSIIEDDHDRVTFYTDPCLHLYWTDCCVSGYITILVQIFEGHIFCGCHKFSIFTILFSRITGFWHSIISMLHIINCKFLRT